MKDTKERLEELGLAENFCNKIIFDGTLYYKILNYSTKYHLFVAVKATDKLFLNILAAGTRTTEHDIITPTILSLADISLILLKGTESKDGSQDLNTKILSVQSNKFSFTKMAEIYKEIGVPEPHPTVRNSIEDEDEEISTEAIRKRSLEWVDHEKSEEKVPEVIVIKPQNGPADLTDVLKPAPAQAQSHSIPIPTVPIPPLRKDGSPNWTLCDQKPAENKFEESDNLTKAIDECSEAIDNCMKTLV